MKAKITKIGTFLKNGDPTGWEFFGDNVIAAKISPNGSTYGGYTKEELLEIYENNMKKTAQKAEQTEIKDEIDLNQPVYDFAGKRIKMTEELDGVLVDFLRFAIGQTQSKTPDEMIRKARLVEKLKSDTASFKAEEIVILEKCFVQVFRDQISIQILDIIAPNELK